MHHVSVMGFPCQYVILILLVICFISHVTDHHPLSLTIGYLFTLVSEVSCCTNIFTID